MADSVSGVAEVKAGTLQEQRLQLLLEIEPAKRCSYPLAGLDSAVEDVHTRLGGGVCHAEVTIDDGGAPKMVHAATSVGDDYLCWVFTEFECVPRVRHADGECIVVETYPPDRVVVTDFVERLDELTERVCLRRLTSDGRGDSTESKTVTINLSSLAAKQREATFIAIHHGYYETPRRMELTTLTRALDISRSAFSRRLNAMEARLTTAVFDSE